MSEYFKYNEQGERIFDLPWATLQFDDGPITLDYFDTVLMKYRSDPQFNHVVWMSDDEKYHRIQVEPEAFKTLEDMKFRKVVEILPNQETEDWFLATLMKDVEIDELTVPRDWTYNG